MKMDATEKWQAEIEAWKVDFEKQTSELMERFSAKTGLQAAEVHIKIIPGQPAEFNIAINFDDRFPPTPGADPRRTKPL